MQTPIPGATEADGLTGASAAPLVVANPLLNPASSYAVVHHNIRFGLLRRSSGNLLHWLWS